MNARDDGALEALIVALGEQFAREGLTVERFDTHISTVLLAGEHAYKFKKPVDFGFLDFSTLARRRHYCERELELNRRHAPGIYLDVLPVTAGPTLGGEGPALEYTLRMRRFATADRLDMVLARGEVQDADLTALAQMLAASHAHAAGAPPVGTYGSPTLIRHQLLAGLECLGDIDPDLSGLLRELDGACTATVAAFEQRLQTGHVRDCHGDLHLTNLVRHAGHWSAFDCIEFDDELRYIDTASDLAFLLMDLDVRGQFTFANRLLNDYLEASGDHAALSVLRYYLVYRTVVRAKVARLAADGSGDAADRDARARATRHLALARRYLDEQAAPALFLMHGVSGSGKSWVARRLADVLGCVHLRSDVERKRLAGLAPGADSGSAPDSGLYTPDSTAATYARLLHLADTVLGHAYPVIVDATCLQAAQRAPFAALAREHGCPYVIIDCDAPREVLEARIRARQAAGEDPSEATTEVLARQLAQRESLSAKEQHHVVRADGLLADAPRLRALPGRGRLRPT